MNTVFKVGGEFMWKSQRISSATGSYWKPWFIGHQILENKPSFIMHNSLADVWSNKIMTIFNSDVEPLSKYSPEMLHLPPATGIFNENLY